MKTLLFRSIAIGLVLLIAASPLWATCGGGGGGGGGGMASGGAAPEVYYVPWKIRKPKDPEPKGLVLYWFPASKEELQKSSLRTSRALSLYAGQCISMELADSTNPHATELSGESKLPVAVLATPEGKPVTKLENTAGKLKVGDLEKLVMTEMKQRETALDTQLKDGKEKAKAGDKEGAIPLLKAVAEQECLFPKKAKDAAKELKKLGAEVAIMDDHAFPSPVFAPAQSARIERTMYLGLMAELGAKYRTAERLFAAAHRMDPADPAPLRYLGEVYRHHTGEWDKAREVFQKILDMPADPLSRAVALHGLGKMTIHDGEFKKGLALMEQSIEAYPLALTYRNLAVYWNSEGDPKRGNDYTQLALELDPNDPYNIVFAAVFMVPNGKRGEALKIARANEGLLAASYNLAAVYAQTGQRKKALALLKRHFFTYERYQAVRAKEMMEARVDAVFDSLRDDHEFMALTSGADGKLQMPMRGMNAPGQNR